MSDYLIEFPEDDVIEVLFDDVIVTGTEPPSGTISITENGDYDVTDFAEASVNVPQGITPTGTINITTNGTHDVTTYAEASVNVPQGVFPTGSLSVTENGTYDVTNYANANVNVPTFPNNMEMIPITLNADTKQLDIPFELSGNIQAVYVICEPVNGNIRYSMTNVAAHYLYGSNSWYNISSRRGYTANVEYNGNALLTISVDDVNKVLSIEVTASSINDYYFRKNLSYTAFIVHEVLT